ncbi:hypothetical protein DFH06DRAFT_459185 [Mycena polygramma]|nr:hypothetical protein DFH06DRAFT_459185 [Mycena polygramma]
MERSVLFPEPSQQTEILGLLRSHSSSPSDLTTSALADELVRYDKGISRLRAQLAAAEADYGVLQQHYERVFSLAAPIRRLPSEVLLQLFEECGDSMEADYDPEYPAPLLRSPSISDELACLARKPLLTVAQVCVRWHGIVMGTPTLWNTLELDSIELWSDKKSVRKTEALLKLILDRGGRTPLTFSISAFQGMHCAGGFELLAQHSERWQMARFYCRAADIRALRSVKGRLPLLETLALEVHDSSAYAMEPFELAPRLKRFTMGGHLLPAPAATYLHQLDTFGFLGQDVVQISNAVSFMSRLPHGLDVRLELFLGRWTRYNNNLPNILPATTSNIAGLSIDTRDYFKPEECVAALSDIFTSLTLPHLRALKFVSEEAPSSLMYWAHSPFLALATRSSFSTNLNSLHLCDVVVTEADLLDALAVLPALQDLEISDHRVVRHHGVDRLLITDSLLTALTLTPTPDAPRFVPLLRSLLCHSILQFDDHVFLEFVLSRRRPATESDSVPFASRLYWWPGHRRALDVGVAAQLRELCIRKELVWDFARAALW